MSAGVSLLASALHPLWAMAGITNRPEPVEDDNQQRVEARKDQLPDVEQQTKHQHLVGKDQEEPLNVRDRLSETGAGRGPTHHGH